MQTLLNISEQLRNIQVVNFVNAEMELLNFNLKYQVFSLNKIIVYDFVFFNPDLYCLVTITSSY